LTYFWSLAVMAGIVWIVREASTVTAGVFFVIVVLLQYCVLVLRYPFSVCLNMKVMKVDSSSSQVVVRQQRRQRTG